MAFRHIFGTRGVIYAVADDGALRWFRYTGEGEQDPAGAQNWAPNSGNQIGRGWAGGFRHHFATGGVIYSVADNGDLTWRRYNGQGEQDPAGAQNWAPNSGNQIGRGW